MRLSTLLGLAPTRAMRSSSGSCAGTTVVPITEDIAHAAVAAFEHYGGRGQNFSDCLSYACAKAHGAAFLFKGDDFARTGIVRA